MLPKKNITLWSSQGNEQTLEFASQLSADLKKCLQRFRVDVETNCIQESQPPNEATIYVLSEKDFSNWEAAKGIENHISQANTMCVIIDPIDLHSLPITGKVKPIYFWEKSFETSEILLIRQTSTELQAKYWEKVTDIAVAVSEYVLGNNSKTKKPTVYVSQVYQALQAEWENLARTFSNLGFEVNPSSPLSNNIDDCTMQITELASSSQLVVHLIPPTYNPFFVNQHTSLAEHQCNVTAKLISANRVKCQRIIWIPSMYEATDEEIQVLIERIQRDEDQSRNTKILKSSLEDLKRLCIQIIKGAPQSFDATDAKNYFVFETVSNSVLAEAAKYAEKYKTNIATNLNGITYRQHMSNLAKAQNIAILYSGANPMWLKVKISEILKSKGLDSFVSFEKILLVDSSLDKATAVDTSIFTHILGNPNDLLEHLNLQSAN